MKIKKIPSSKPRSEIVVDNIFMFLEKKHLKQKDLAEVCLVNASDVSKWKSYKTKINMDDLEKIANFLQVSIDDLFYTEEEKKRCVPELKGKIDPSSILAQRLVSIKIGVANIKVHIPIIAIIIFSLVILGIMLKFFENLDEYNLLYMCLYILIMFFFDKLATQKETFVVNYMSDVFFMIENKKNQFFIYELIGKIICLLYAVGISGFLFYILVDSYSDFVLSLFIPVAIYLLLSINEFTYLRKNYKEEIYDFEYQAYYKSYHVLIFSGLILLIFVIAFSEGYSPGFFIVFSILDFISRIIQFSLCSIKSAEYKIVMIDENKNISYLVKDLKKYF